VNDDNDDDGSNNNYNNNTSNLLVCGLFNYAVRSSDNTALNNKTNK
jgi:hypothetical protein